MSEVITNNLALEPVKVPKEKKPTLPAKFAKFMQFGFFFVSSMKDAGVFDDSTSDTLFERLCLFSSVDDQKDFYQAWMNSSKDSNKALRKIVSAKIKADKPKKPRATRQKKDPSNDSSNDSTDKPKKPRAKKSNNNDLVNQLSLLANSNPLNTTEPYPLPLTNTNSKAKKSRSKKSKTSSTETVITPTPPPETSEEEEDVLDVRELIVDGVNYLIDDSTGNVFNSESHDHIGVYDAKTQKIKFF
jgi:hypothetical protein